MGPLARDGNPQQLLNNDGVVHCAPAPCLHMADRTGIGNIGGAQTPMTAKQRKNHPRNFEFFFTFLEQSQLRVGQAGHRL